MTWERLSNKLCGRDSCYSNKLSQGYLSNSRSKKEVNSIGRFNREGLHQLQNCFVADEDLHGRNVLLLTCFCYVNCSDTPERVSNTCCRAERAILVVEVNRQNFSAIYVSLLQMLCFMRAEAGPCSMWLMFIGLLY